MKNLFRAAIFILLGVALASCSVSQNGQEASTDTSWVLIDDFEGQTDLEGWVLLDAQNDTDPFVPDPQITEIQQSDAGANAYMIRKPADEGVVGNRKALAWKKLPAPVGVGETATFFTRINVEYFPNNHSFGLSNQPSEEIGELSYDAFEPMIRITDKSESDGTKNDGTLMVLVGHKKYSKIFNPKTGDVAKPLEPGLWYDVWYVVDNSLKENGGQTYKLYVRGGEFSEQTLVFEDATFRIGREEPLSHFISICNTGPARDPYGNGGVRYDDLYMSVGEELSSPL